MVKQQDFLHALASPANHHNLNSNTSIMNGRASNSCTSSLGHSELGFMRSNHLGLHTQHQGSNNHSGISASNFNSNHHLFHHMSQNNQRNRYIASATSSSMNSNLAHSHFANSQNPRHNHHLSLSSNSSAMSSVSSSPSASISPSSITLGSPPNLGSSGYPSGSSTNNHHYTKNVTDNSHLSSMQQQSQQQSSGSQQNTSRYKTELCRPFEENGTCKYGEKCQFAHGLSELRTLTRHPKYKTEFCRTFHTTGFCPYGPRCHFIHNSKTPGKQPPVAIGSYAGIPFGHQSSHSASPSTSPISSASSATTTNGSLSSSESITSSSPPSSSRLIDVTETRYQYGALGHMNENRSNRSMTPSVVGDRQRVHTGSATSNQKKNENDEANHSSGCASETQRLFWLHSHMSESSRWPSAMCAGVLIGSNNARRTWQMQA